MVSEEVVSGGFNRINFGLPVLAMEAFPFTEYTVKLFGNLVENHLKVPME